MTENKNTLLIIYTVMFSIMFTACIPRTEMDKLIFVRSVGIDKSEDKVKLTVASKRESTSKSQGKGETAQKTTLLFSEGKTVFDANRNFLNFAEKDIFWGHTQYILLGESAVKEDVLKYLDFFIRNHENRLNTSVAVVNGAKASELFESFGNKHVYERMENLYSNVGALSESKEILLSEFIEKLNSKYSSAYVPCVYIAKNTKDMEAENGDKQNDIVLDGFAVFKGAKLVGYIKGKKARGLNWINGDVKSGIIDVKDPKGNHIALEIIESDVVIKTKVTGEIPDVVVKVRVNSNIGELEGRVDVFNDASISQLEIQQAQTVKNEVESAIEFAKQNSVDILGFGDKIFHQHPVKWEKIKDNWEEVFPKVSVKVEVESKISRVYNIGKPIRHWEEKEK